MDTQCCYRGPFGQEKDIREETKAKRQNTQQSTHSEKRKQKKGGELPTPRERKIRRCSENNQIEMNSIKYSNRLQTLVKLPLPMISCKRYEDAVEGYSRFRREDDKETEALFPGSGTDIRQDSKRGYRERVCVCVSVCVCWFGFCMLGTRGDEEVPNTSIHTDVLHKESVLRKYMGTFCFQVSLSKTR